MAYLTLGVLGAMQVTLADGETVKFRSDQTRALLAYLAVEADRPHRREALTGLLWPDEPEETARHNLRQALVNLRKAIGDHSASPPYLLITHDEIQFNPTSRFTLDLASFNAHLAGTANHSHPRLDTCALCAPHLQQAVELYRGKFLQEFFLSDSAEFEEWAVAQRESLHQRALDALTDLGDYYEQNDDWSATKRCALRQLELDPWREQAHRQLMRAFAREGQTGAALAQYETCRHVLSEEMGVEPSSETRELYEKIKSRNWTFEIGRLKEHPISNIQPPTSTRSVQLPTHLTPFIGRERELQDLGRLIADPSCRWITLVGSGGMGKTRLAVQTAANHRGEFALGAAFVPLVAVESVDALVPAIADALGFSFYGSASPRIQLFNYLRDKSMLLVLDNVEQLSSAADVFVDLLQHTTEIKLLMTSREPLNVQGEWVVEVEGLQIPEEDGIQAMEASAAVALFVQRAQRTRVGFALSAEDRPSVARLCRLVDGTPLALELAATWVRTLSVKEIVNEIERNLDFLSAPVRDLPERHRSMRVVFDHSWKLLTKEEQGVLLRMSVFHGGFRREAAEDVAGATLSALSSLITKSLVRRSSDNRYDMHELIRQFATGYFSDYPEEQKETQACHGRYYLKYLSQADGRLSSSSQREALAELTAEIGNFHTAWDWAVVHGEFALIEQTMRAFFRLYDTRGWYQEATGLLDRALNALEMTQGQTLPSRTSQVALGHVLIIRAWLAFRLDKNELAIKMFERSVDILRPLNEPRVLVEAITYLGLILELTGNYTKALELYSEGLEMATAIGDRWFAALCLSSLNGMLVTTHSTARPENAYERLQSAVADWRLIGDPRGIAFGLRILSQSAFTLGRYDEARAALEESAALDSSIGFDWGLGSAYRGLGLIAQAQGEHLQAVDMFHKSLDAFTEVGARQDAARVLVEMSRSIFALGNDAEAERGWRKALQITTETQSTFVALEALVGMSALKAKQGDIEQALEWSLIVLNHPASLQETRHRAEILRLELESRLTPQQIASAQAQTKSFDQVVAQILSIE